MDKVKKLVVLGGGESGVGAAILGKDKGMYVFLSDFGQISPRYSAVLDAEGIEWEEGRHSAERILEADMVVKSPGISPAAPMVRQIVEKGIPVVSEIEFAGFFTDATTICITGSNGKTTTTMLTHHILTQAGVDAGLAGNVGRSMALKVAREPHDVYVIELSSFQLENMYSFRADVAVMLNITPDHLDRYDYKMENYVDAKFRILQNMTPADAFVYWQDDPVVTERLATYDTDVTEYPFGEHRRENTHAYVDGEGMLHISTPRTSLVMARKDLSLTGTHNLYNSMAAGLAACLVGVEADKVRQGLCTFGGVEHRLEYVCTTHGGVRWINDSKATNVNSCFYALGSMPSGSASVVLILGGKDKGNDYSEILPLVKEKVHTIVCMGKDNTKLLEFFTPHVPSIVDTHSLEEAVAACSDAAREGDTVLLSPCCASFDLFTSYENRGELFKQAVKNLL